MSSILLLFLSSVSLIYGQQFTPVSFRLPSPPTLSGALSPNYALYNVEKLHENKIRGPTSFAFLNGNVYTVTADRKVLNIAPCIPQVVVSLALPGCSSVQQCGLLTSIRVDNTGHLLVLDAYRGVYRVNPTTKVIETLYSSTTPVGGRTPKYLNGMVQHPDGSILLSDSSDRFDAVNELYIILEGRTSGRILHLNPNTKAIIEMFKDGFAFPNGLEISPDGRSLLVAESGRARVLSISLVPETFRQVSVFADNLPGVPGNIRRSARGTYWVGLSLIRHAGMANSMDMYSANPAARQRTVYSVDLNTIKSYYPRYGMIVELDSTGKIVGSLHDPTGYTFSSVSEAAENEGLLYVGTPSNPFTGRIILPQGDGRNVTIDSVIQVLRSRCQISEENLAQAKETLTTYLNKLSAASSTTPAPTTAAATTPAPPPAASTTPTAPPAATTTVKQVP